MVKSRSFSYFLPTVPACLIQITIDHVAKLIYSVRMGRPTKLTAKVAEAICENARKGLPLGRAAVLVAVHRVTAQRWLAEGALEIADAADDAELSLCAQFTIDFESARAGYLLGLATKWQECIDEGDYNTAKSVQVMMASQSPGEYSERRVTRSVDQRTTMSAEINVNRFADMTTGELATERQQIAARREATEIADADDADWRSAAVRLPKTGKEIPETNNLDSGSRTVKSDVGGLAANERGSPHDISPTRARAPLPDSLDPEKFMP